MKTKILACALSAAMLGGLAVPACAAEPQTETTTLKATVNSSFLLSIPANQTVLYNAAKTDIGRVSVTGNVLSTEEVTVTVDKTNFKHATKDAAIPYTLTNNEIPFTKGVWSETELRDATPKAVDLSVNVDAADWTAAPAGAYTSTITFNAALAPIVAP